MYKIIKQIFVLGLAMVTWQACSSIDYDGEYSKNGEYNAKNQVYFNIENAADTLFDYSFGTRPTSMTTYTVNVRVMLAGRLKKEPQHFKVVADPSSTAKEGVHYQALDSDPVIPADSGSVVFPVVLMRENLSDTHNDSIRLTLRLVPTSDLDLRFPDKTKVSITYNNVLSKPSWWDSYLRAYFGMPAYTPAKYRMLLSFYNSDPREIERSMNRTGMAQLYRNVQKVIAYFRENPE